MKVFLLHRDHDFGVKPELRDTIFDAMASGDVLAIANVRRDLKRRQEPGTALAPTGNDAVLTQDLELSTLWNAMAAGDEFLFEMAKRAVLSPLSEPDAIIYRQHVLADCLEHPEIARQIYQLAVEALENERKVGGLWPRSGPDRILHRSVEVLKLHVDVLKQLQQIAGEQAANFRSEGFTRFFAMLRDALADDYLQQVGHHLHELEFKRGVSRAPNSARVRGRPLHGTDAARAALDRAAAVREPLGELQLRQSCPRRERLPGAGGDPGKGINLLANTVAQSADHVRNFFSVLRLELAFYLGCLNLHDKLAEKQEPVCFPHPCAANQLTLTAEGVYDVSLTFHLENPVVGNEVNSAESR